MMRPYIGSWKRLAVSGVAAVLFGLGTLVWPDVTLWALVVLWGAYVLVDGITMLSAAITDRFLLHRGWVAFWGVTGIAAGIVTFLWPSITAMALLAVIATWSLIIGGSRIAYAITARKQVPGAWAIGLGGALWCCSVLLLADPGDGALGITWAIGWLAFLFGGLELWLASVVRHETHASGRRSDPPRPGPHCGRPTWPRPCPLSTCRPPRRRLRPTAWRRRRTPAIARSSCRSTARTSPKVRSPRPRRSPLGSGPPSTPSPSRSQTSSSDACASKPRGHSAPDLTTHASTSRSTPTSPAPFSAVPQSSTPAWSACRPTVGDESQAP